MWTELRRALADGDSSGRSPFAASIVDGTTTFALESECADVQARVDAYYPRSGPVPARPTFRVRESIRPALVTLVAEYAARHAPSVWRTRFGGDSRYGTYREDRLRVYVPEAALDHCMVRRGRMIWVLLSDTGTSWAFRVARDVLLRVRENDGAVLFHGGAVSGPHGAFLMVGPASAGKTTAICAALDALKWDYLANDRVFVSETRSGFQVSTFPVPVRIGRGTLYDLPDVWKSLTLVRPQSADFAAADGAPESLAHAFGGQDKLELVPAELAIALGVGRRVAAPLRTIVFPTVRLDRSGYEVAPVATDETIRILRDQLQTPWDMTWKQDWIWRLRRAPEELRRDAERLIERLVVHVPACRLAFGPDLRRHMPAVRAALLDVVSASTPSAQVRHAGP